MAERFIVDIPGTVAFGPFDDEQEAGRFAAFAAAAIDPATVRPLLSPLAELLNWRDHLFTPIEGDDDEHPF